MSPTRSTAAFQRAHSTPSASRFWSDTDVLFKPSHVVLLNFDFFSRLKDSHDEGCDQRKFGRNRMWWRARKDKQSTFANGLVQFEHDGTPRRRRCVLPAIRPKTPAEKQLPIGRSFKFNLEFSRKWMATHFRYLNSCLKHCTFLILKLLAYTQIKRI